MSRIVPTVLALLFAAGGAQAPIVPPEGPVDGWTKKGEELKFVGKDLYGHIDGGAEVFHELGFRDLIVQDYGKGEEQITLEIYRMDGPKAALGIYLMQTTRETPIEGLGARSTGNRYQLSFIAGESFIQVNNFSGEENLVTGMVSLAKRILVETHVEELREDWNLLPKDGRVAGSERYIRGPFTLQPIFTFGEGDILSLGGKIFGQVAEYEDKSKDVFTRIIIDYSNAEAARAAYDHLIENLDSYIEVLDRRDAAFTFQDYRKQFGRVALTDVTMELIVNLADRPQ